MTVRLLGMLVPMLTVLVRCRRVLLGLLVLPMGVMMGRLMMMVCGSMMVCSGLDVMLYGRVFGLVCHGRVLLKERFGETGAHRAHDRPAVSPPVSVPAVRITGSPGHL
jgi:hypothetical protein